MQLNILDKDKIEHNLLPSYGASHVMPDKLVGYFNTQGYQLVATDVYMAMFGIGNTLGF